MENKMKQNKNSSVVLRVASATLAAVFLFCSLSLPSFAVSQNNLSFEALPVLSSLSTDSLRSSGKYVFTNYVSGALFDDIYPCYVSGGNISGYVIFSPSYHESTCISICRASGSANAMSGNVITSILNYNFYYGRFVYSMSIAESNIPFYDTFEDACADFNTFINGGAGLANPVSLTKDVPAGNALYIQIPTNATVSISCTMTSEVAHPQSWITNQYWGTASGYPSSIAGNPSGSTPISWNGYGDKTIFNRYKSFYWNGTVSSSDGYIFIVNPYASIDEYDQSFNPTIYVSVDQAKGYKYYQLTGGISSNGTIGQQSDGTTASGEYDSSTGQWTSVNDSTGLPWSPSEGGGNLITTNSINDWLRTIATQISNFFQGAIGAVTTLVSAGSAFINQLISLYSWLPAPVYAVLSSALIIVITIGVIKVFV